jgi:hypothetical protein
MQQTDFLVEAHIEPDERLELLAAVAAVLLEYQQVKGADPRMWRPSARGQWRMLARWEQLQGPA